MASTDFIPAEVFPPGEFIRDELEAREMDQRTLAAIMGCSERLVSEIIAGKRAVTPETAKRLGAAFGTSAQLWMNLETTYRLQMVGDVDEGVRQRAEIYETAPVKEIIKRGWIVPSENVDVLKARLLKFLDRNSLSEPSSFAAAARMSTEYGVFTGAQEAWLMRSRHLSGAIDAERFSPRRFEEAIVRLSSLRMNPEDVRQVPRVLAEGGVRFLVVEHLPGTKIDGACFWRNATSPVVVLSLRFDRIDYFWFTLMHELGHVQAGDGKASPIADVELVGDGETEVREKSPIEHAADEFAMERVVPQADLDDFIARTRPFFSREKVTGFARRIKVHPGLVVGQLQHRREIPYENLRALLVKVRGSLLESSLYDGWDVTPNIDL